MDKALITQTVGGLSEREPLELAGQVANRAAVSHVVEEYLGRKARNTIRTQAAGRFQGHKKSEPQFGMIAVSKPATTKRGSGGAYHNP